MFDSSKNLKKDYLTFLDLYYATALKHWPALHLVAATQAPVQCSLIKYLHFWVEIAIYPMIKYESVIISELSD